MKRLMPILMAVLVGCSGSAQEKTSLSSAKPKPKTDLSKSLLTKKDMVEAVSQVDKAVSKVLKIAPLLLPAETSTSAASREEVIRIFNRLYETYKPSFKFTPRFIKYNPAVLTVAKSNPERAMLEKLIRWQFVAKVGPIAAGKKNTLTLEEFGDALGFFTLRVADLTHLPSARWSPYLQTDYADSLRPGNAKSR